MTEQYEVWEVLRAEEAFCLTSTAQPVRMGCVFCSYICSPEVQLVYAGIGRYTGCHRPASMARVRDDCSVGFHVSLPRRS